MLQFHRVTLDLLYLRDVEYDECIELIRKFLKETGIEDVSADMFYQANALLEKADSLGLDFWGWVTGVKREDLVNYFGYNGSGFFPFSRRTFWNEKFQYAEYRKNPFPKEVLGFTGPIPDESEKDTLGFKDSHLQPFSRGTFYHPRDSSSDDTTSSGLETFDNGVFQTDPGYSIVPYGREYSPIDPSSTFGFDETDLQSFNTGTFYHIRERIILPDEPSFIIEDELYRLYIYKRVMDLISGNQIPPEEPPEEEEPEEPIDVDVKTLADFYELAMITVISQYSCSPRIMGIIETFCRNIDPSADLNVFYDEIFNLDTARGIGLDIWGAIVGASRIITGRSDRQYFGYLGSLLQPFNTYPFYDSDGNVNDFKLLDEPYRNLIRFKAAANISSVELPKLNELMATLFPNTDCYVLEYAPMQIIFVFNRYLTEYELALLKSVGVALKGAGVGWYWIECDTKYTFGFDGSFLQPFNQGTFDLSVQGGLLQHHYLYDPDTQLGFDESEFQPFMQGVFSLER